MIDIKELEKILTSTKIVLLERIRKLSQASELVSDIEKEIFGRGDLNGTSDKEYLKVFIAHQAKYREVLEDYDKRLDEVERDLWNQMLHIDRD